MTIFNDVSEPQAATMLALICLAIGPLLTGVLQWLKREIIKISDLFINLLFTGFILILVVLIPVITKEDPLGSIVAPVFLGVLILFTVVCMLFLAIKMWHEYQKSDADKKKKLKRLVVNILLCIVALFLFALYSLCLYLHTLEYLLPIACAGISVVLCWLAYDGLKKWKNKDNSSAQKRQGFQKFVICATLCLVVVLTFIAIAIFTPTSNVDPTNSSEPSATTSEET